MVNGFTFNGAHSSTKYIRAIKTVRPILAAQKHQFVEIPFKTGSYLIPDTSRVDITIPIQVLLRLPSNVSVMEVGRQWATWLGSDNWKQLIFDDDPNYYYEAACISTITVEDLKRNELTIEFRCKSEMKAVGT